MVTSSGRRASCNDVIRFLKEWFMDKCIPIMAVSDGGLQFSSQAFKQVCDEWEIHNMSSPRHPSANGAAVKAFKSLITKSCHGKTIDIDSY